jgi:hypothetical protein
MSISFKLLVFIWVKNYFIWVNLLHEITHELVGLKKLSKDKNDLELPEN